MLSLFSSGTALFLSVCFIKCMKATVFVGLLINVGRFFRTYKYECDDNDYDHSSLCWEKRIHSKDRIFVIYTLNSGLISSLRKMA